MKYKPYDRVKQSFKNTLILLFTLILTTIIGLILQKIHFQDASIIMTFLLGVLLTARLTTGYLYGILASIFSILIYNFLFTIPLYTFAVNDPGYLVTFGIMMITALITSTLTTHVKESAANALEKESEMRALYQLTNHLTDAKDNYEVASISISIISDILDCQAACLCLDQKGIPEPIYIQQTKLGTQIKRQTEQIDNIVNSIRDIHTSYYIDSEFYNWLIYGKDNVLGLIRIPIETGSTMTIAQNGLLRAVTESIALAMDRIIITEQKMQYRDKTIQERYRSNLLRAISHDLRTPLTGIMGTSEIIMGISQSADPRHNLAKQIWDNADWLHSLVENILSLTKLQDGKLTLNKQLEPVEEVIGSAILHINNRSPQYDIKVTMPDELFLVPMDPSLITQVLINLLDNSINHSSPEHAIYIAVTKDAKRENAVFSVKDFGEGISENDLPNIFKIFYTTMSKHEKGQRGLGLGLSICDAIIKAHGGTITGCNNPDGLGCSFTFTLPLEAN